MRRPAVSIAGGEPLLHRDMPRIVKGYIAKKKLVILCTNALLLKKKIHEYEPSPFFTWSIHLDGDKAMHDHAVDLDGTYEVAIEAIELAKSKGFRVQVNCTVFDGADPARLAAFFDEMERLGVEITVSPGYAYERAADKEHFLSRERTKQFFRDVFKRGDGGRAWTFTNSPSVPRLSRRQPDLSVYPLVDAAAHRLRLAEALLSDRRGLCRHLQGAHGRHRLGAVRRRQL